MGDLFPAKFHEDCHGQSVAFTPRTSRQRIERHSLQQFSQQRLVCLSDREIKVFIV